MTASTRSLFRRLMLVMAKYRTPAIFIDDAIACVIDRRQSLKHFRPN
jgi:hypothetical protein